MTPEGWTRALVADVADPGPRSIAIGPFGSSLKSEVYADHGIPVIRGQNIAKGRAIDDSDLVFVPKEVADTFPACVVREGDLVFPHRGAIGRVAIVGGREYLLSSSMMKLTCDPSVVDPTYVFYYFRGPGHRELLTRASTVGTPGIGQPLKSLRGIPIVFPSLGQQRGIAEVLGALDDKIAANAQLGAAAMELAGLVFDQAVAGRATRPMSSVLKPVLGGTPSRAREDFWSPSDHPWASAKDVTGAAFGVVVDTAEHISEEAIKRTKAKPLPRGSVILTARGTVGAVARSGEPMSFNQSCYGFVPGPIPQGALYFSILRATEQAKAMAHGSVFDTITIRTFDHLQVVDLESAAWAKVEGRVSPLLTVAEQSVRQSTSLSTTRDALLPLLMSGKIRVKDAERVLDGETEGVV